MTGLPILRVDLAAPSPVYRQIADGLRLLLVSGTLAPGARLPTVRQLATDLNVHHNTVAEAYRMMADEGWIDLRRGRGAVVVKRRPPKMPPGGDQARADFSQRMRELIAQAMSNGISRRTIARELSSLAASLTET
jgi:DNA-binding transcriptional regulator YhcF (GntR family)